MKQIKLLLFIIACTNVFAACKKINVKYNTYVDGIVKNKITQMPVAGIPVEIIGCSPIGSFGSTKCLETIVTTTTDASGYYSMLVESEKWQSYKIAVGDNAILEPSSYPYSVSINTGKNNKIDFSQSPIKILQIHIKVQRHDRNWIDIGITNADMQGFYSADFYHGFNPMNDFDSTYHRKVLADRQYQAYVIFTDRATQYSTPTNRLDITKKFTINNIDTSYVDFFVQ